MVFGLLLKKSRSLILNGIFIIKYLALNYSKF
jgi:hypothetical protein